MDRRFFNTADGLGPTMSILYSLSLRDTWNRHPLLSVNYLFLFLFPSPLITVPSIPNFRLVRVFLSGLSSKKRLHLFPVISAVEFRINLNFFGYFMLAIDFSLSIASDDGSLLWLFKGTTIF